MHLDRFRQYGDICFLFFGRPQFVTAKQVFMYWMSQFLESQQNLTKDANGRHVHITVVCIVMTEYRVTPLDLCIHH